MVCVFFFFKQKTAYEMRISDLSSDVGSSDLELALHRHEDLDHLHDAGRQLVAALQLLDLVLEPVLEPLDALVEMAADPLEFGHRLIVRHDDLAPQARSEEHTSELQSLMRTSYAVFCLKKQKKQTTIHTTISIQHTN